MVRWVRRVRLRWIRTMHLEPVGLATHQMQERDSRRAAPQPLPVAPRTRRVTMAVDAASPNVRAPALLRSRGWVC